MTIYLRAERVWRRKALGKACARIRVRLRPCAAAGSCCIPAAARYASAGSLGLGCTVPLPQVVWIRAPSDADDKMCIITQLDQVQNEAQVLQHRALVQHARKPSHDIPHMACEANK